MQLKLDPVLNILEVLVENVNLDDHDANNNTALDTVTDMECRKNV